MGRMWARNLTNHPDTDLSAWVDAVPGRVREACAELGYEPPLVEEGLEDAIARAHPDFVVNVTTPESHMPVTVAALEAGLPVLCEKPMADTMEAAAAMIRASERSGKLLMISQSRRYNNQLRAFKELLDADIGEVGLLWSQFSVGAHFGGFRDDMQSPLVQDMAIHTFDTARYLTGADPVAVYCEEFNPGWSWYRGDACASAVFEMTGGARYTYSGAWCAEGMATSWLSDWRASGPGGTACWDGEGAPVGEVVAGSGEFVSPTRPVTGAAPVLRPEEIEGSLEEFLSALRTGEAPVGEAHDNIQSLAMVAGALTSAREHRRVLISEVMPGAGG